MVTSNITGAATVAGALNLGVINGYVPASGATFTVLSAKLTCRQFQ